MKKPITTDTYDFPTLIEGGYVYIDKTAYLRRMISGVDGRFFFMCRPRRFGKSLMISTLEQIFKGNRKLFKGLAIAKSDYDWKKYPVIRLDMSMFDPSIGTDGVCRELSIVIAEQMRAIGLRVPKAESPGILMSLLIEGLASKSETGKVVVLIDEYDNPISGLLGRDRELDAMQQALQHFYRIFKVHVGQIRFLMMTGVSKFTKLSVFSGLNNLTDLSMRPEYAALLGYTEDELSKYFSSHLLDFAKAEKTTKRQIMDEILAWYDSYRFSPDCEVCVCNPISVGSALTQRKFTGFWDRTGSASLIIERLRKIGKLPTELERIDVREDIMDACDPYDLPYASLMYQAGYLTIKDAAPNGTLTLGIPNREVRQSLYGGFLSDLLHDSAKSFESMARQLTAALEESATNAQKVAEILNAVFAMVPHEWKIKSEAEAKRYFLLFMRMAGATINAEVQSSNGRADAILETGKSVHIFEFKYGKNVRAALKQCRDRNYAAPFMADWRQVFYAGVNYDCENRLIAIEVANARGEPVNEPVNFRGEAVNEVVNSICEVVNEVVNSNPGLRKPELIPLVGKSRATVERALASLIAAGQIEFRGAPKTGGYYRLGRS